MADLNRWFDSVGHYSRLTLAEARDKLREEIYPRDALGYGQPGKGTTCPCCDQHAQVYRWALYGTAAAMLIKLWRAGGTTEYVESRSVKQRGQGGDGTRLRFWDLAEEQDGRREDGGKSGWWIVTELGEAFVLRQTSIPKYVHVYNGRRLRKFGPPVWIDDVLGKRFDYRGLMDGVMAEATAA